MLLTLFNGALLTVLKAGIKELDSLPADISTRVVYYRTEAKSVDKYRNSWCYYLIPAIKDNNQNLIEYLVTQVALSDKELKWDDLPRVLNVLLDYNTVLRLNDNTLCFIARSLGEVKYKGGITAYYTLDKLVYLLAKQARLDLARCVIASNSILNLSLLRGIADSTILAEKLEAEAHLALFWTIYNNTIGAEYSETAVISDLLVDLETGSRIPYMLESLTAYFNSDIH